MNKNNDIEIERIVEAIKEYIKENLEYVDMVDGKSVGNNSRERI